MRVKLPHQSGMFLSRRSHGLLRSSPVCGRLLSAMAQPATSEKFEDTVEPTSTDMSSQDLAHTAKMDYESYFSQRGRSQKPSPIRQLIPLLKIPGMVSLGGGLPNPSTFPISKVTVELTDGRTIQLGNENENVGPSNKGTVVGDLSGGLQYSDSAGLPSLTRQLMGMQESEHAPPSIDGGRKIVVTGGSQEALWKTFEILIDSSSSLLVENPTYASALTAVPPLGCQVVGVKTDKDGLVPEDLDNILRDWKEEEKGPKPKVLYTIPTAGNPTGRSLSEERRKQIYAIARKPENNLLILEDDPYYYLHFGDTPKKSFLSMDEDGRVIRFDSFSKILSAGLRVGFATAPTALADAMTMHCHYSNLHTSGISQAIVASLLELWGPAGWSEHISTVRAFYKSRRDAFLQSANKHLTGLAEWDEPDGGMFVWLKLKGIEDAEDLIKNEAMKEKVLMVPGSAFDPKGGPTPYVRAAFSTASDEMIDTALSRFASLLKRKAQQQ